MTYSQQFASWKTWWNDDCDFSINALAWNTDMVNKTSENELLRSTEREKACVHVFERKSQCVSMCASEIQRERRCPWATIVPVTYEQKLKLLQHLQYNI